MAESFDEKSGRISIKQGIFTFIVDGYDSESVQVFNDKGDMPQFIREYTLSLQDSKKVKNMPYARWELLGNMAEKLARKCR